MPNAMPIVYEFDEYMQHVNNYCLMDKDAHAIIKSNPELSYNDINWALIKGNELDGGIDKSETTPITKPLIRYN